MSALLGFDPLLEGELLWTPLLIVLGKVVVIFVIAAVAETNHPPFDLVEAEQELTGGFFTEYTGIKFAIFYLAEFMNVITMSAIAVTLFFGGPNGPGLGFLPADGIKLFFKEQSEPNTADRRIFRIAPYLAVLPAFLAFSIVPIGGVVTIAGHETFLQLDDLPFGILWLLAMSGLGLYGVLLAGWASGSKYPLLGSVRASAQLLSYEAAFGLAIVGVLVQANTLSTRGIVIQQGWDGFQSIFNGDWYWLPAIVLPMMISTTVVSTPWSNTGSVSATSPLEAGPNMVVTGWSPRGAR